MSGTMKTLLQKLVVLSLTLILFSSCVAIKAPQIWTGMTINEFINEAKYQELVSMDSGWAIYRVIYGYNAENVMFYYFYDNKLVKMNRGQRDVDVRVRVN
jgi:hypothetical protein